MNSTSELARLLEAHVADVPADAIHKMVVKLDKSFSGQGNCIIKIPGGSNADDIEALFPTMKFMGMGVSWETYVVLLLTASDQGLHACIHCGARLHLTHPPVLGSNFQVRAANCKPGCVGRGLCSRRQRGAVSSTEWSGTCSGRCTCIQTQEQQGDRCGL